jgi:hypothetical protein
LRAARAFTGARINAPLNIEVPLLRKIADNQSLNQAAHAWRMPSTKRLVNLLELANQGPAMRAALAEEVAELLTDWPSDCPIEMRASCEALLARAVREVDDATRARLRVRLFADPDLCNRILPREHQDRTLVERARAGENMVQRIARALNVEESLASRILDDASGHALAVACKSLGLNRAAFSSLALLCKPSSDVAACHARLDAFDAVSAVEASHELRRWSAPAHAAA